MHGINKSVYWTQLSKTADRGSSIIRLEEAVDWRPGEEIVVGPTSSQPYEAEVFRICKLRTLLWSAYVELIIFNDSSYSYSNRDTTELLQLGFLLHNAMVITGRHLKWIPLVRSAGGPCMIFVSMI